MDLPFLEKFRANQLKVPTAQAMSVQDFIAPPSLEISPEYLEVGERYAKTFFIFSYPRYLTTGWFSPIINIDVPMDIAFYIHPADTTEIMKNLRKRITGTQAEMMERAERGLIRSPKLEFAYENMEMLRDRLQTGQERMFSLGIYMTVFSNTYEDMKKVETTLRSILEGRLIYIKPAIYRQGDGYITTSPYGSDRLLVHTPMNTAPLSSIFPFVSFDLSSSQGILYGINQHNNSLVLFDRFTMESFNQILFGVSGSGKSIAYNESVLVQDTDGQIKRVVIGEYIDRLMDEGIVQRVDEETQGVIDPKIKVFTFDDEMKGEWANVTVAARKDSPDTMYRFKTQSGREITTTGDHNMVALKQGEIAVLKSSEIEEGSYIPLPRKIEFKHEVEIERVDLIDLLRDCKDIYVDGAQELISQNYDQIKKLNIDEKLNRYLYKYRVGRVIPLHYLLKISEELNIDMPDNVRLTSIHRGHSMNRYLPVNVALAELLGFISAEGFVGEKVVTITNIDSFVRDRIKYNLEQLNISYFETKKDIRIGGKVFVETLKSLHGVKKAGEKTVPSIILTLDDSLVASYLSAYFEGDGTVGGNGEVTATSKSKLLISDLSLLLYRFSIVGRIREKYKRATNSDHQGDTYWQIVISGKDIQSYAHSIGFISERKNDALSLFLDRPSNTNVDVVPELSSIFSEIHNLFGFQLQDVKSIKGIRHEAYSPSKDNLSRINQEIRMKIDEFKKTYASLDILQSLPELNEIVSEGENDRDLNRELIKSLGSSWFSVRTRRRCFSNNALEIAKAVRGYDVSLSDIKDSIYQGFKETDLQVKTFNPTLQPALVDRPEGNTDYGLIQSAAALVCERYEQILYNNIPRVEMLLDRLEILANSDLFWDPIVQIQEIESAHPYVYDLMVDNEVFVAGHGGMFVHNSYFQKLDILRSLMTGIDVLIIDPENEYQHMAEAAGGSFLNISLTSPNHLNPFDLPVPREDEDPGAVLRSSIINLVGLMRIMLGGMTPEEDAIMDSALTITYAARDITEDSDPATWQENTPIMSDLEDVLETMEGADSMVRRLSKYTTGTYSSFFNQRSNIDLDKGLVVFGIRDMEEQLKQLAMFIIMRYIWKEITSELKKRILVIDEAWWMMQSEDGASFLFGLVKRARKYWLGVTTITQDVSDFMRSEYGQPIVANSAIQILMKQSPSTINVVQDTFNLTEEEKLRLLQASVGEGLFFAGTKHAAIRVVASYAEDQVITTAPEEIKKIKEAKRRLKESREK